MLHTAAPEPAREGRGRAAKAEALLWLSRAPCCQRQVAPHRPEVQKPSQVQSVLVAAWEAFPLLGFVPALCLVLLLQSLPCYSPLRALSSCLESCVSHAEKGPAAWKTNLQSPAGWALKCCVPRAFADHPQIGGGLHHGNTFMYGICFVSPRNLIRDAQPELLN